MVAGILGQSKDSNDEPLRGHLVAQGKRYIRVSDLIQQGFEDAERFVSEILGHDFEQLQYMPAVKFWREYMRAKEKHTEMVKQAEKLNK